MGAYVGLVNLADQEHPKLGCDKYSGTREFFRLVIDLPHVGIRKSKAPDNFDKLYRPLEFKLWYTKIVGMENEELWKEMLDVLRQDKSWYIDFSL